MPPPLDGWVMDPPPEAARAPDTGGWVMDPPPEAARAPLPAEASTGGWVMDPPPGAPPAPAQAPPAPVAPATPPEPWALGETPTPYTDNPLDAPPPPPGAPHGFGASLAEGMVDTMSQGRQLARGDAFSDENIPPPVERTFMGKVGYTLAPAAVTAAGIGLGAAGGTAAGSPAGPVGATIGGITGGVAGGGALGFAQSLIPAYRDAVQRGLSHDDAVNEAYKMAAATGVLTGATAPLFAWAPFKSWISNALLHSVVTGPVVGATERGLVTPAITGQPAPSADEMASGLLSDIVTGGLTTAGMHGGPALARHFAPDGRPTLDVGVPETPLGQSLLTGAPGAPGTAPAPEPPPGSYGRELFTAPTEPPPPAQATPGVPMTGPPVIAPAPTPTPALPPPAEPEPTPAPGTPPDGTARPVSPDPAIIPPAPVAAPVAAPGQPVPEPGGVRPPGADPTGIVPVAPGAEVQPVRPDGTAPGAGPAPEPGAAAPGVPGVEPPGAVPGQETPPVPGQELPKPPGEPPVPARTEGEQPPATSIPATSDEIWRAVNAVPDVLNLRPIFERLKTMPPEDALQITRDLERGGDGTTSRQAAEILRQALEGDTSRLDAYERAGKERDGQTPAPSPPPPVEPPAVSTPAPAPAPEPHAPGSPADILASLDRANAPDEAYREAFSTGAKNPLKPGETWRGRLVKWVEQERAATAVEPVRAPDEATPPMTVETLPQQILMLAREHSGDPPASGFHASEREMLEAAGVHAYTDEDGIQRFPEYPLHQEVARRQKAGEIDNSMTLYDAAHIARWEAAKAAARAATARKPETSARETNTTAEDTLTKRAPPFAAPRGARAPGAPAPLPKIVGAAPRVAPEPVPVPGRAPTLEDYHYSRDVSMHRQAFHDALAGTGEDPRTAANKPMPEQTALLSKALKDKYGFTDVKVLPGGEPRIVRDQLLNMHQNMQNMAHALGWAPEVMSLDGRVSLELVPRQFDGGQWMGRYKWGGNARTIQISGGSNSFAHELWHGIDNYLADVLNQNPNKQSLLTRSARAGELQPGQDPVQAAFAHVLNTMSHGSGEILLRRLVLEQTAKKVDKAGNPTPRAVQARAVLDRLNSAATGGLRIPDSNFVAQAKGMPNPRYMASVEELFARTAEAYTAHKMVQAGVPDTAGVVKSDQAYQDRTIGYLRGAYPDPHDRVRIFNAMDMLSHEMQRAAVLNHGHAPAQKASTAHTLAMWHDRPPDIGPGFMARLRADAAALRPERLLNSDHDAILFPKDREPAPPTYNTKTGVARPKNMGERMGDTAGGWFLSVMGNIERWRKQIPPGARPYLTQILDRIGVSHEGRLQPMTFEERYRHPARKKSAELTDAFRDSGMVNRVGRVWTSKLDDAMIWHTLTTGESTYPVDHLNPNGSRLPIPSKILTFAEKARPILDAMQKMAGDAKMDVGHASEGGGYAPRVYDDHKILGHEGEYRRDMTEVTKIIFDKDIDAVPDTERPARLNEWWRAMGEAVRDDPTLDPDVLDAMTTLGKNLNRVKAIEAELAAGPGGPGVNPTTHDPVKLTAEMAGLVDENQNIFDAFRDRVRDHYAPIEAHNRFQRIALGGISNWETFGPKSQFIKGRTLPPEADRILRNWMIQKPREGLYAYIHGMSQKIAYHETFGANGSEIEALIQHMVDAGAHRTVTDEISRFVELLTGRALRDVDNTTNVITNTVSALGTMMLLSGSSVTAMGEPMATLINGGNMRQLVRTYTNLAGQLFAGFPFAGQNLKQAAAERMTAARYIGGIVDSMQSSAAANRFQDYSGTPRIASVVNGFMELGMGKMIRHLRAAGLDAGSRHLMPLLARYATDPAKGKYELDRQDDARRMLREWGVPDKRFQELRDFLDGVGGPPSPAQMAAAGPVGELYEFAANRMLDRFNQDPSPAEKPVGGLKNPVLRMMFGLTSFIYTFFRHTMQPWIERAAHARQRQFDRSTEAGDPFPRMQAAAARFASWAGALTNMAVFLAGTALLYAVRTYFLAHQVWQKHAEAGDLLSWLASGAISQSGIAGPLDIIFQGLTGLRYRADVASFTQGAYPAAITRGLTDVAKMFAAVFGKTPGTNTDVYNGIYALIQMVAKPGMLTALTWLAQRVPEGGTLAALITAASVIGTSSTSTRGLTDMLAGERGTMLPDKPAAGSRAGAIQLPSGHSASAPAHPGAGAIQLPGSHATGAGTSASGGGMTSIAAGALDDVAVPMLRMLPPWGTSAALGLSAVTALVAVLRQAHEYKTQGEPPAKAR